MSVKVRQRKGRWWLYIDHKGRRKAKCVGTDKRAAQDAAKQIEAKLALGDCGVIAERERRPFDVYYRAWLNAYVSTHCKLSTLAAYETAGRVHFAPAFGGKEINAITRDDVKALVAAMHAKGLTRNSIKANLAPLSEMFNHAIEDGHLGSNPAARILKRSRMDAGVAREADFLTREELGLLLDACLNHYPRFYPFVLTLARTGIRLGEALALEWEDIDFSSRFAEVRRSLVDGRVTTPKSGKTRRVDLSRQLTETLRAFHVEQRKAALRLGEPAPKRLFPGLDPDNFRNREWRRMLVRAGLRYVTPHCLRHTYASLLIAQGESPAYVKEQMGHYSIRVTVDTYGHLVPGGNRAAVDRLDDVPGATIRNPAATP